MSQLARRSARVSATYGLLLAVGPAIGGIVFLSAYTIIDLLTAGRAIRVGSFAADYWGVVLVGSYVFGLVPAFLTAVAAIVVSNLRLGRGQRLAIITAIGALLSPFIIAAVLLGDISQLLAKPTSLIVTACTGGVATLVCMALVELWFPLPPREPES